jgi:hypothetical protein
MDPSEIAPAFAFLLRRGLVPATSDYRPQEFGNATLIMVGDVVSVRFQRDRGQVFVDVGSQEVGWHKLEYALEVVDRSVTQEQLGEPPDPSKLAQLLEARWTEVVGLLSDPRRVEDLRAFAEQKAAALLGKMFGKR